MTRTPVLTLVLGQLVCGCGHPTTTVSRAPARTVAPPSPGPANELPEGFDELVAATQQLTAKPVTQRALIQALHAVAAVVRVEDAQAAAEIDAVAERIAASDAPSPVALVQEALLRARSSLGARMPTTPAAEVRDAYVRAARAVDALEAREPLIAQEEHVQTAFAALTNFIATLHGARSVPELARSIEVGYIADAFRERIDRASDLVGELATARDWDVAYDASHRALWALGEVVEVAPLTAPPREWRSLVLTIRFSALRIRRLDPVGQERSDYLRAGLLASVTAIERMTQDASVIARARRAAEAIDPHVLFVFQRAAIQDAFRIHVQAFDLIARQMDGERRSARR